MSIIDSPTSLLVGTEEGYVAQASNVNGTSAVYRNISPLPALRGLLGKLIKIVQEPSNSRGYILFGSLGALRCADTTAASPTWSVLNLSSYGKLIDTLQVDVRNNITPATQVTGSTTTSTSKMYQVVFTATFSIGFGSATDSDCFYCQITNPSSPTQSRYYISQGTQCEPSGGFIGASLNGGAPFSPPPTYNPDHIYSVVVPGTGLPFSSFYCDGSVVQDNAGTYTVRVYEIYNFTAIPKDSIDVGVTLPPNNPNFYTNSTITSLDSSIYKLVLSGTFSAGFGNPNDTEVFYANIINSPQRYFISGGNGGTVCQPLGDYIEAATDVGNFRPLPAYSALHSYTVYIPGTGSNFKFKYCDGAVYSDNLGAYHVDIAETNVPARVDINIGSIVSTGVRAGQYGWLTRRHISGVDYVCFNFTTNDFVTVRSTVIAKYSATILYSIATSSINNWATGSSQFIWVAAGDPSAGDFKIYESQNGGTTFQSVSTPSLGLGGGLIYQPPSLPPRSAATTSNLVALQSVTGSTLQISGFNNVVKNIAGVGGAVTTQAIDSDFQNGQDLSFVTKNGTTWTLLHSLDGGSNWTTATLPSGWDVQSVKRWGSNPNFLLVGGSGTFATSTDQGSTWNNLWTPFSNWANTAFGTWSGKLISALVGVPPVPTLTGRGDCTTGNQSNNVQTIGGNPVVMQTGEKYEEMTDLQVNTPAGIMAFTRMYQQSKQSNPNYQAIGLGWSHNHQIALDLTGLPGVLVMRTRTGGETRFTQVAGNPSRYEGDPGSSAFVIVSGGNYTLTGSDNSTFTFDSTGKLTTYTFPNQEVWTYSYYPSGFVMGLLQYVQDVYGNQLQFVYINNSGQFNHLKLWRVGDRTVTGLTGGSPAGNYVEFTYATEKLNGAVVSSPRALLASVRDVRGNVWSFDYYGQQVGQTNAQQQSLLTRRLSPSVDTSGDGLPDGSLTLEAVTYTLSGGKITTLDQDRGIQGAAAPLLHTTYTIEENTAAQTTAGKATTYQFANTLLQSVQDPLGNGAVQALNYQYRPEVQNDANGNMTLLRWSLDGKQLQQVRDAQGFLTKFSYNIGGASDGTLDYSLDAQGRKTQYTYADVTSPRLPTRVKVFDANGTTVLRWQEFTYDSNGRTLTEKTLDPTSGTTVLAQVTRSYYASGNGAGLLQTLSQKDIGGTNDQTTTYTYDTLGRMVQTNQNSTFGSCSVSRTVYDAAGNVVASICNYDPGAGPAPTTAAEAVALYSATFPDKNRVTTYGYDALNRRVQMTSDAGASYAQTALTVYDALDRVVRTIANYVANGTIPDPYVHNRIDFLHGTDNTQNLVTDTAYNERGMVRKQIDVLGNVTLFGYDDAGRLVKTVSNASQPTYNNGYGTGGDPTLGAYVANTAPDLDLVTRSQYDAAGNLVKTTDTLGRVSISVYDALNRPYKTIRSPKAAATLDLKPGDTGYDPANDPRSAQYAPGTAPDTDLIDTTEYDSLGRVTRSQDTLGNWMLYGYDALGRQVRTVRNASSPTYNLTTDPALASYVVSPATDLDLVTDTTYDVNGRVLYAVNLNGEKTWAAYDGLGRAVKTVVNAVGTATDNGVNDPRSATYVESGSTDRDYISRTQYDLNGRVQWTVDPLGRKTWYVYDSLGRQVKVVQNCTWVSGTPAPEDPTYVGQHATDTAKDVISQTVYDTQGRVWKTLDSRGNETRFEYDVLGRRSKTTRNYVDGVYNTATPDEDLIDTVTYDLAGRVVKAIDNAANETRFEYDAAGRRTKIIQNYQDGIYSAAQPDRDLISLTVYNKGGQVTTATDARGTQTAFTYDAAGRSLTVVQAAGSALATTSYTSYDKGGRVLRTIQNYRPGPNDPAPDAKDGSGNFLFNPTAHGAAEDTNLISAYTLDKLGRQVAVRDVVSNSMTMSYDKDGQVKQMADALGIVTAYRYDRARRRVRTIAGFVQGIFSDPATWFWDNTTGQKKWKDGSSSAITFGMNNDQNVLAEATYDKGGRMTALRDPRGNLTAYTYDLLDRRTGLTNPLNQSWASAFTETSGTAQVTLTNPLGYQTQQTTDKLGRAKGIAYLSESPKLTPDVTFTYDAAGNRVKMNEVNGATPVRAINFNYDAARRLNSVGFDDDGNGTVDRTVGYEYDAGGLRTKLTLPGNLVVTYQYNTRGQLTQLTDWSSAATRYAYDSVGRLASAEQANGLRRQHRYDAAGRLTRLRHSASNRTLGDFAYTLDARGNRIQAVETTPKVGTGAVTYAYNDAAITYESGAWVDANPFKSSARHNTGMQLVFAGIGDAILRMGTGPDHSTYDLYVNGDLWRSVDGYAATASEVALTLTLRGEGPHRLEVRNRPEKHPLSSGYTVRFKSLVTAATAQSFDLNTLVYTYDALSRLRIADRYPAVNTGATTLRREAYAYDVAGNRTQQAVSINGGAATTTNYTYDAANRMATAGAASLTYDTAGRMTNDGVNTYTWDRADRMLSMGASSYLYNGMGQRLSQTVSAQVTQYLLDVQPGLYQVLAATTGANTTRYVHGPLGIQNQQNPAGTWVAPLQDGLGSVRGVVNNTLALQESRLYTSYGEVFGATGTSQTIFGYTGEPTDGNGLVYLRARYYNPTLGVFPSLDPLEGDMGNPLSIDQYAYVQANPVNWTDPSGQCPENPGPFDVFGWRCRFLAEGLAAKTGQPVQNFIWMNYGDLEALTALGSAASFGTGARQTLNNASIIPNLARANFGVTMQALLQYTTCPSNNPIQTLLGVLGIGITAYGRLSEIVAGGLSTFAIASAGALALNAQGTAITSATQAGSVSVNAAGIAGSVAGGVSLGYGFAGAWNNLTNFVDNLLLFESQGLPWNKALERAPTYERVIDAKGDKKWDRKGCYRHCPDLEPIQYTTTDINACEALQAKYNPMAAAAPTCREATDLLNGYLGALNVTNNCRCRFKHCKDKEW